MFKVGDIICQVVIALSFIDGYLNSHLLEKMLVVDNEISLRKTKVSILTSGYMALLYVTLTHVRKRRYRKRVNRRITCCR